LDDFVYIFPTDSTIQCALEAGASLNYLTAGQGLKLSSQTTTTEGFAKFRLTTGKDG
jgi:hypothetical protein